MTGRWTVTRTWPHSWADFDTRQLACDSQARFHDKAVVAVRGDGSRDQNTSATDFMLERYPPYGPTQSYCKARLVLVIYNLPRIVLPLGSNRSVRQLYPDLLVFLFLLPLIVEANAGGLLLQDNGQTWIC